MDYKSLRKDLTDYFGSGGMMGEVIAVDNASYEELIRIARRWDFKLDKYNLNEDK